MAHISLSSHSWPAMWDQTVFVYLVNFAIADYQPDLQCSRNARNSTEPSLMGHMTVAWGGD